MWRLSKEAISNGIVSTTRFRKDPKRKVQRSLTPAPKRVLSGAKGGQASRRAAHRRRAGNSTNTGMTEQRALPSAQWLVPEQRQTSSSGMMTRPSPEQDYFVTQQPAQSPYFMDICDDDSQFTYIYPPGQSAQTQTDLPKIWAPGQAPPDYDNTPDWKIPTFQPHGSSSEPFQAPCQETGPLFWYQQ